MSIVLYSSDCPKCKMIERIMKEKGLDFSIVNDDKVYLPLAEENKIVSMPFAKIDGEVVDFRELQKFVMEVE